MCFVTFEQYSHGQWSIEAYFEEILHQQLSL